MTTACILDNHSTRMLPQIPRRSVREAPLLFTLVPTYPSALQGRVNTSEDEYNFCYVHSRARHRHFGILADIGVFSGYYARDPHLKHGVAGWAEADPS